MAFQKLCRAHPLLPQTRGTWIISVPFLPSRIPASWKLLRWKKHKTLSHSFFTLLGPVKGLQPSRQHKRALWLHTASPTTRLSTPRWRFPHRALQNWPRPLPAASPSPSAQHGNGISGCPHLFSQLSSETGMPLRSVSWRNELAWDCRAGSRPGQDDDVLYRRAMLAALALSSESYLPLSEEPQSRQSSWFQFSSFSSEITKASAAGRAGHAAGVCSVWSGTASSQDRSPSPPPTLEFLPGAAVTALAAGP